LDGLASTVRDGCLHGLIRAAADSGTTTAVRRRDSGRTLAGAGVRGTCAQRRSATTRRRYGLACGRSCTSAASHRVSARTSAPRPARVDGRRGRHVRAPPAAAAAALQLRRLPDLPVDMRADGGSATATHRIRGIRAGAPAVVGHLQAAIRGPPFPPVLQAARAR
jgi:hypothetical protein